MNYTDLIRDFCYNENGSVKPKVECRAGLINRFILDEGMDIDEAENVVDKTLRELNLWNEPRLEDLIREYDEEPAPQP